MTSKPEGDSTGLVGYEKGRRTRSRIIVRAAELFATHGYGGTSIDQVARASGLTKGAIYAHFRDKQHLWTACLEHGLRVIDTPVRPEAEDPGDRLSAFLTWLGESLAAAPTTRSFFLQVIRERAEDPAALDVVLAVLGDTYAALRTLIAAAGPEVDADAFAFIAFSALLLDPELHRFHALMTGSTEPTHTLEVTVRQLVDSIQRN